MSNDFAAAEPGDRRCGGETTSISHRKTNSNNFSQFLRPVCTSIEDIRLSLPEGLGNATTTTCRHRPGGIISHAGYQVTAASWKSESIVRLLSGGGALRVIGRDSVGSVICRPLGGGSDLDIYVPPSLLVVADPDRSATDPSTKCAAENA